MFPQIFQVFYVRLLTFNDNSNLSKATARVYEWNITAYININLYDLFDKEFFKLLMLCGCYKFTSTRTRPILFTSIYRYIILRRQIDMGHANISMLKYRIRLLFLSDSIQVDIWISRHMSTLTIFTSFKCILYFISLTTSNATGIITNSRRLHWFY